MNEVVEEGGHVQIFAGGGRDDGRVAGPAQALVPLGAIGGDIQEVVKLAPQGVVEQLVDPGSAVSMEPVASMSERMWKAVKRPESTWATPSTFT